MNVLRAGMSAPPLMVAAGWQPRSHASDVPRAYVYRASPEPPQSTPKPSIVSVDGNDGPCPWRSFAQRPASMPPARC